MPSKQPACLAIFDHDGVLVDSFELHQRAWIELGHQTGHSITPAFIHETFGMTNASILRMLLGDDLDPNELSRLSNLKETLYREEARPRLSLMAGVRPLLDEFSRRDFLLAIGSSGPRANLELTVEVCGLSGRFVAISSSEDIRHGKPDPEVFLVAAAKSVVSPKQCVVFEDALVGIQAAKSAGMLTVGVGTTRALDELRAAGADIITSSLQDFDVESCVCTLRQRIGV